MVSMLLSKISSCDDDINPYWALVHNHVNNCFGTGTKIYKWKGIMNALERRHYDKGIDF